jgi:SAM-dependent methyltransferase
MLGYQEMNRAGWGHLARNACEFCRPCRREDLAYATQLLDPQSWIPWDRIRSVLCLASGGGQQGPLFASLGYDVTVVDLSPEQLQLDRVTAKQFGLNLSCVEADICDLSPFYGRQFDLVYQAVSACYVPDVRKVYEQVFRVLKPNGYYRVDHWSPIHLQLPQYGAWDGGAYRIVHPQTTRRPIQWREWKADGSENPTCWHYIHSLDRLIGDLCEAGFAIERFEERQGGDLSAEPGSSAHLAAFVPPFFAILSHRLQRPRVQGSGAL